MQKTMKATRAIAVMTLAALRVRRKCCRIVSVDVIPARGVVGAVGVLANSDPGWDLSFTLMLTAPSNDDWAVYLVRVIV